jgi:NET1-associated nuclear protein 1 (U3 small nucleolar RNA-associated protein 17)
VGSYKQLPLGAAAFSGDGSLLALAAGGCVTLWRPASNTLVGVLTQPPGAGGGAIHALAFLAGSPTLVAATTGEVPQLIAWDLLTTAPRWVLTVPTCALAADPAAPRFAVGVPAGAAGQGNPGGVLVLGPGAPEPLAVCAVPNGSSPAALLFVAPGTPLAAAAGGGGSGSPLLLVTSDRHFALLPAPGAQPAGEAEAEAATSGVAAGGDGQQAPASVLEATFGGMPAAVGGGGGAAGSAGVQPQAAGEAARKVVSRLFDAPSHVLPPPSALVPTLLELLVSGPPGQRRDGQ